VVAANLAHRMHRHSNTAALRQLLLRWNRPLAPLRRIEHHVQLLCKSAFQLPAKAAWTLFASWDHFAVACLKSETPMAHEIQAYLLDAGVAAAANIIVEQETGHTAISASAPCARLAGIAGITSTGSRDAKTVSRPY
jgi:hypothetical protein